MSKQLKMIVCSLLFITMSCSCFSQQYHFYHVVLKKEDVIKFLREPEFAYFKFTYYQSDHKAKHFELIGGAFDGLDNQIGSSFFLNRISASSKENLKCLFPGTLKLLKETMNDKGINGSTDYIFIPQQYKNGTPGQKDYVSYLIEDINRQKLVSYTIDPSPPAHQ